MNRLSLERRAAIIRALIDGNSVRATCRIIGAAKGTVLSLVAEIGTACDAYQRSRHIDLPCERIQVDEVWSFVGAKEKNASYEKKVNGGWGDAWTWVAIDADTKLVPTWMVAPRHTLTATDFMGDICARLNGRVQLTTDGASFYEAAVARTFTPEGVDYAILRKVYGIAEESSAPAARRYSPPVVVSADREPVFGNPDPKH